MLFLFLSVEVKNCVGGIVELDEEGLRATFFSRRYFARNSMLSERDSPVFAQNAQI